MISESFNIWLVFVLSLHPSCAFKTTNWSQKRNVEIALQDTNIGILKTPSVIACAVECANVLPCMSYSYHAGNNTCLLFSIPFTDETTLIVGDGDDGWTSYNSICGIGQTTVEYVYQRNLNMCYHLESKEEKSITEAMLFCSVDGRMLRIDTIEKQGHISQFLTSLSVSIVYIGGSFETPTNSFVYEDGTPLNFFYWYPTNPKGKLAIRMRLKNDFQWGNTRGDDELPFLCEIAP